MDGKLRLIRAEENDQGSTERRFFDPELFSEILQRFSLNPEKALPEELVGCLRQMARERLFDFISLCKSYQSEFESLFDLLKKKGKDEKALFLSVERFVQNVYLKLMARLGELDRNILGKARKLIVVDEELDSIAERLAEKIEQDLRSAAIPGQVLTIERLRKIIG